MLSWSLRMTLIVSYGAAPLFAYVLYKAFRAMKTLGWIAPESSGRPGWMLGISVFLMLHVYPISIMMHAPLAGLGLPSVPRAIYDGAPWAYWILAYPYWALMLTVVQTAPLILAGDLAKLPLWRAYRRHKLRWGRIEAISVLLLLAAGATYVAGRIYTDTCRVRVSFAALEIPDLPADLEGFTIAHISDLQADPLTDDARMQRYIDTVNAARPDLVLFTGDLVTRDTAYIDAGARMLGNIEAPYGVAACLGDHDVWSDPDAITAALEREGVTVLDDKSLVVPVQNSRILVTGVTNTYSRRFHPEQMDQLLAQRSGANASILMAHQHSRRMIDAIAEGPYDLFLGGHTHGGQVMIRLPGWVFTAVMFETPYISGFYKNKNLTICINNGLGLTLAPVRFQAPAEVTLITLTGAGT